MRKILLITILLFLLIIGTYYFYPEQQVREGIIYDSLVVVKSSYQLKAFSKGKLIKSYPVSLGKNPVGGKKYEGDNRTPEGLYYINDKNPNSVFYKNLGISYPDSQDIADAARIGKPAGGDVKIHGLSNGLCFLGKFHRWFNWTTGCIALTNNEIDEIYCRTSIGTPINILATENFPSK
jgi:murein L,D-transpeptidase YafK